MSKHICKFCNEKIPYNRDNYEMGMLADRMNSPDWFTTDLRVNLVWDDTKYLEMIGLVNHILYQYRDSPLIPKILIRFFSFDVDMIAGITSNKLFFEVKSEKIKDSASYKTLVNQRIQELKEIRDSFLNGD